jgi:hypothetical protein
MPQTPLAAGRLNLVELNRGPRSRGSYGDSSGFGEGCQSLRRCCRFRHVVARSSWEGLPRHERWAAGPRSGLGTAGEPRVRRGERIAPCG